MNNLLQQEEEIIKYINNPSEEYRPEIIEILSQLCRIKHQSTIVYSSSMNYLQQQEEEIIKYINNPSEEYRPDIIEILSQLCRIKHQSTIVYSSSRYCALSGQELTDKSIRSPARIYNSETIDQNIHFNLTNIRKSYYKHKYQQQLLEKLKDQGEVKSIPHVKQNIDASNIEVVFYVLKESLLRDQNRKLLEEINTNPNAKKFLNEYCNGNIEYVKYFVDAHECCQKKVTLSSDDFNPQYNRNWDNFAEKEQRGPHYHRYDYYFPRGCYGFGLNIKKYGSNQDWIKMDGNPNEWRILYHGTKNYAVNAIVKNNLQSGGGQAYSNYDCQDEFGKNVKVGHGIYFSNNFNVCIKDGYAQYHKIGDKQFAVIFMSRVDPKKIRQSKEMIGPQYFVVNQSLDVRPYRILLHETPVKN